MADPRIPADDLGVVRDLIKEILRRLDELEKPTGTQLSRIVEEVRSLVDSLDERVQEYITTYSMTRAEIIGLAWLGVLQPGKGGTGTSNASGNIFTSGGPWYAVYVKTNGEMGHAPSLRALKRDIRVAFFGTADPDPMSFLEFPVMKYRFKDDVDERGDEAIAQYGLIAEDLEAAGLEPLLIRDEEGNLFGIAYDRIWMMHHEILRAQQAHIDDLSRRIADLEGGQHGSV